MQQIHITTFTASRSQLDDVKCTEHFRHALLYNLRNLDLNAITLSADRHEEYYWCHDRNTTSTSIPDASFSHGHKKLGL